jgi:hypothetical protein
MPGSTVFSSSSTWWVTASEPLEDLLRGEVLLLAVLDVLGGAGLVAGRRVDLGFLGAAVRDQERGQGGKQRRTLGRIGPQLLEQPLDLAVVLHDQVDDVGQLRLLRVGDIWLSYPRGDGPNRDLALSTQTTQEAPCPRAAISLTASARRPRRRCSPGT